MVLTGIWTTEGEKIDALVFSKKFKIHRGKVSEDVSSVKNEKCFGVLCYEKGLAGNKYSGLVGGTDSTISDIIAPLLSLEWARIVVNMMEEGLFPVSSHSWEAIEKELRRRKYDGITLCPYYMPDVVGFYVLKNISNYTTAQIEDSAATEGAIENYLIGKGYKWLPDTTTWQNPQGNLWDRRNQTWLDDTA